MAKSDGMECAEYWLGHYGAPRKAQAEPESLTDGDCTCGAAWGTAEGPCVCEPRDAYGQDDARGILAVNPYAEGSEEWHAWGLGYADAESEGTGFKLSALDAVAVLTLGKGATRSDFDYAQWDAITDAFMDGYQTYIAGWRV